MLIQYFSGWKIRFINIAKLPTKIYFEKFINQLNIFYNRNMILFRQGAVKTFLMEQQLNNFLASPTKMYFFVEEILTI